MLAIFSLFKKSSSEDIFIDFRKREKDGEKNPFNWLPLKCVPTTDWTCNLGVCLDPGSNPQPSSVPWCSVMENRSNCLLLWKPMLKRQGLMWRKVVYLQILAIWKMGDSCPKAHLHLSVEAEAFIRRERGTEQRDQGRGLKGSLRADELGPFQKDRW